MEETNNADSPNHCTKQLKNLQGSENFIPLSPQWLLAKPEKNKTGTATGDSELGPYPGSINRSDYTKSPSNGMNNHTTEKKTDVFRPSLQVSEFGNCERWGDEERETSSALQRDRWREGGKYLGDTRKMERRMDNSNRSSPGPRYGLSGRSTDSNSRLSNFDQRRESKWTTRWGPDDKNSNYRREKLLDTNRNLDMPRDKDLLPVVNHGKEDKEGDHRPWRSDTYHSRGKALRTNGIRHKESKEFTVTGEVTGQKSHASPGTSWRPQTLEEQSDFPSHEAGPRMTELGWPQSQKDRHTTEKVSEGFGSDMTRDCTTKGQPSGVLERERNANKCLPHPPLEDLSLYYKDPQSRIQGPFSGSDLIKWFEAGFFGIDLEVRLAGASCDTPFSLLGDVIPQLRAKAGPPPGFNGPRQREPAATCGSEISGLGNLRNSSSETDILQSELRNGQESLSVAENRILESIIADNLSSSLLEKLALSEGLRGYTETNSVGSLPTIGKEGDLNFLLTQKLLLENLRSSLYPHILANSPHQVSHPQMSTLQANVEKSLAVNTGASVLSCFPGKGVTGTSQDKVETQYNQLFHLLATYGIQQQKQQTQNPPSFANQMSQSIDQLSSVATNESLLSYVLSQDANILKMLQEQQQQLLLEQQRQLLQQQQQQILQQQQLLRQQEQHKISQVPPNHQSCQSICEESSGHAETVSKAPESSIDNHVSRAPHEMFQTSSQVSAHTSFDSPWHHAPHEMFRASFRSPSHASQDALTTGPTLLSKVPTDVGYVASSETSALGFPHQFSENITHKDVWDASLMKRTADIQHKHLLVPPPIAKDVLSQETIEKSSQGTTFLHMHDHVSNKSDTEAEVHIHNPSEVTKMVPVITAEGATGLHPKHPTSSTHLGSKKISGVPTSNHFNNVKVSSIDTFEEPRRPNEKCDYGKVLSKEVKGAEVCDSKKVSGKKSKKRNNSMTQISSDQLEEVRSAISQSQQSENVGINVVEENFETKTSCKKGDTKPGMKGTRAVLLDQDGHSSRRSVSSVVEATRGMGELGEDESHLFQNGKMHSGQRAWKPAPSFKAKSLLKIQQEEQCREETDLKVPEFGVPFRSARSSSPRTDAIPSLELNSDFNNHQVAGGAGINLGKSENAKNSSKRSYLHDLLAEEVLARSGDIGREAPDDVFIPSLEPLATGNDSSVNDTAIPEAKDTKKSRKKSAKGKVMGVKAATPASVDVSVSCSIAEDKYSHQEPEEISSLPLDTNLEDSVHRKGGLATHLAPAAWSTDSGKVSIRASLRNIQKEQEQRTPFVQEAAPMPTFKKAHSNEGTCGSGPTQSLKEPSPSKATSSIQTNAHGSAQSKSRVEDELFWGHLDQSNGEATDYVLSKPTSLRDIQKEQEERALIQQTASMPTSKRGHSNHTKPGNALVRSLTRSSPPNMASPFQVNALASAQSKSTEDDLFWGPCGQMNEETIDQERCNTPVKGTLTGFSTKQRSLSSTSSAYSHSSSSVATQSSQKGRKDTTTKHSNTSLLEVAGPAGDTINTDMMDVGNADGNVVSGNHGTKGGEKKKGKKGKKVSASVLGFNVVSNRIMMGEIQAIEH